MTSLLQWRYAEKKDHRLRKSFTCARPAKPTYSPQRGVYHPREWEYEVQKWFRGPRAIRADEYLLVGVDSQGIGAFAWWLENDGPSDVFLKAVAIDCRFRGQGQQDKCGPVALELEHEMMTRIRQRAADALPDSLVIEANIDLRNEPSKRFFEHMRFSYLEADGDYEVWSYYENLQVARHPQQPIT